MNETHHSGHVSMSCKIKRAVWNVGYLLLFRPFPTTVFWPWRRTILRLFGAQLAKNSYVYSSVKIWAPWKIRLESKACLGPEVICYNQDLVWLHENVTVSQYSYLCTAGHETNTLNTADAGLITAGITISKNAWVGTRAFIGMGVEVGENAIVGATASVYKDVEPWTVVGGNPAKVIKRRIMNNE